MTSFYAVDEAAATRIAGKKDSTEITSEISIADAAVADEVKRYDDAMKDARIELYVCGFTRAAVDAVDWKFSYTINPAILVTLFWTQRGQRAWMHNS